MIPNAAARYQAVQIKTSTPGDVLVALYDGLFKFLLLGKNAIQNKKRAQAGEALSRAYAIVSEFYVALDHQAYPELCANLVRLYDFCMSRITHANRHFEVGPIDDVVRVLTPVREAFTQAVRMQKTEEKAAAGAERY